MSVLLNSLNSLQARQVNARIKLSKYFGKEDIQDFGLRVENFLQNGTTSYEFILGNSSGRIAGRTERLLQNNDAFLPIAMGLFVKKATLVGGVESPGNDRLASHVDATIFDGAAVGGFTEAQCMQAVYNADLAIYADGKELLYKVDTSLLEHGPTQDFQTIEQRCRIMTKEFVIFGGNENKVTLEMKGANVGTIAGDGAAVGDTEQNKAVIIFSGLIIRGGADKVNHLDAQALMGMGGAAMSM